MFQYMLLLRGATGSPPERSDCCSVSIHAPLARSNHSAGADYKKLFVSIHAPLARSNFLRGLRLQLRLLFQYMLLLRGATLSPLISVVKFVFQYMLLLRGATERTPSALTAGVFQYMLLLRGATALLPRRSVKAESFNTCSSCEEQLNLTELSMVIEVSIHAPLARSNGQRASDASDGAVSIHAPLARSNSASYCASVPTHGFNTCSSCEEQRSPASFLPMTSTFQYMLLLRGATKKDSAGRFAGKVSIHAPLARSNRPSPRSQP